MAVRPLNRVEGDLEYQFWFHRADGSKFLNRVTPDEVIDFSKLLGSYVGLFALASVLFGWLVFRERIATQTWIGLAVVLLGSAIMQLAASSAPVDP